MEVECSRLKFNPSTIAKAFESGL